MPAKEDALRFMLKSHGTVSKGGFRRLTADDLHGSVYSDVVQDIYRKLGGIQAGIPVNPRATWDIEFEGIVVELDEHLHFNRYRELTLSADAYKELVSFPLDPYIFFCSRYEDACLRAGTHGKKWTNPSCERQFGASPIKGQLDGAGPARWRQRAFYDFLKDLSSLIMGFPVVRLAIWDEVNILGQTRTVDWILRNPSDQGTKAILEIIENRLPKPIR